MPIHHLIEGRQRDLGGFSVRRVLPAAGTQMVGPFIFFDHMGPAVFASGAGVDVRPHPHISLATVTYLYAGALLHRDNLGFVREIRPGDVNWMTAGTGIAHSERTPPGERATGAQLHGLQSWVALPDGHEDDPPSFHHHPAATLPELRVGNAELRVIAGEAFGRRSPVHVVWPTLYVDVSLPEGAEFELPPDYSEQAVYVSEGQIDIDGAATAATQLAMLDGGEATRIRALRTSRLMLLGGERFPTPRFIWWNFVSSSRDRIEQAKRDWRDGRFTPVPGESESIPLPDG